MVNVSTAMQEVSPTASNCSAETLRRPCIECALKLVGAHAGRKTRYTYAVMVEDCQGLEGAVGLVKFDLSAAPEKAVVGELRFGEGRTGGEAVFVPSSGNAAELKGPFSAHLLL